MLGSISVLVTILPDGLRISSHSCAPPAATFATMYVGAAVTTGSGRRSAVAGMAGAVAGRLSDTVVVRDACVAAAPHPERTSSAAGIARAARVGVIGTGLRRCC